MEKLNQEKFEALSNEQLIQINGGWGWEVYGCIEYEMLGMCCSLIQMRRKRLFGGTEYCNEED